MRRAIGLLVIAVVAGILSPGLKAGVIVTSIFDLTQLQIVPASGTLQFLPPLTAQAFAYALDSQGRADSQFDSQDNVAANAVAVAILASASAGADAAALTANASSFVNIPGELNASASSAAQGTLVASFQITGEDGPVLVQLNAALSGTQNLTTDAYGIQATSEIVFSLLLPDISSSPQLFYDNQLQIGPSQTLSSSYSSPLTNSLTLNTNTPYTLIAQVDSESSGFNAPEPGCAWTAAAGISLLWFRRRRVR